MKLNAKTQEILDVLSEKIRKFATDNRAVSYTPFTCNESKEYVALVAFPGYSVEFLTDTDPVMGYSFMEIPFLHADRAVGEVSMGLLTRFRFPFSELLFSPYDIHNVLQSRDFRTLDFHYIGSPAQAADCADIILGFIRQNNQLLFDLSKRQELIQLLLANYETDAKILDKKYNPADREADMAGEVVGHTLLLFLHNKLQNSIYRFITTGSSGALSRTLAGCSRKNQLTVFETRYMDFLIKNDFPQPDSLISANAKSVMKKQKNNSILPAVSVILGMLFTLGLYMGFSNLLRAACGDSMEFLATTAGSLGFVFIDIAMIIIVYRVITLLPRFHGDRIALFGFEIKSTWLSALCVAGVLSLLVGLFFTYDGYHNHAVTMDAQHFYIAGEAVPTGKRLEFFYIRGSYIENSNGDSVYAEGGENAELIFTIDGDYENYLYARCFSDENGAALPGTADAIRQRGFPVTEFRDIDAYCAAHGI